MTTSIITTENRNSAEDIPLDLPNAVLLSDADVEFVKAGRGFRYVSKVLLYPVFD